jgi:hypothetical protein
MLSKAKFTVFSNTTSTLKSSFGATAELLFCYILETNLL